MRNLIYNMPSTVEEWYITGSYGEFRFEIPAVFNGGILDTEASLLKLENFKNDIDIRDAGLIVQAVLLEDGSIDMEATAALASEKYAEGTV
jgi:hypothetical protein